MAKILFTIGIQMLGYLLDKFQANLEAKQAFLEFVDKMQVLGIASVKLNEKDAAQMNELRGRRDKLKLVQSEGNNDRT